MNLLEELQKEFGDALETRAATNADTIDGASPEAVAAPRNQDAARDLVAWCGRENLAFVARGGSTHWQVGTRPSRFDLVISSQHLNNIIEHDAGNATVQAEAGITLAKLNEFVAKQKQYLPLDWKDDNETLGGAVAMNRSGVSRLGYRTPRDMVTGLHAALSDGRLIKAGSKVVKNVSGYDLTKLFIGSHGTLGLITQVTIRLRPNDAAQDDRVLTLSSWEEAAHLASRIGEGEFEPVQFHVVATPENMTLHLRFQGAKEAVAVQCERTERLFAEQLNSEAKPQQSTPPAKLELHAILPPATAVQWATHATSQGAERVLWQCGVGEVLAVWNSAENAEETVAALRELAQQLGGFCKVTVAPSELKTPDFVWGKPRGDFDLMRGLKEKYDAANVCSPGRFVGGI